MNRSTSVHRLTALVCCQPCVVRRGIPAVSRRTSSASTRRRGSSSYIHVITRSGSVDCDAADDRTIDAGIEQLSNAIERTQAAAHLQLHAASLREPQRSSTIWLRAIARAVEIDDVYAARAERAIAIQHALRVVRIDGLGREIAFQQAYAAAVAQIDGRNQLHGDESFH